MEYVIRHRGGFYHTSWSPVFAHEATRYPSLEAAIAKCADLQDPTEVVTLADAIAETPIDGYDLQRRLEALRRTRDTWQGKFVSSVGFAARILKGDDVQTSDIVNAITALSDALAARAQVTGYNESIGLIEDVLNP